MVQETSRASGILIYDYLQDFYAFIIGVRSTLLFINLYVIFQPNVILINNLRTN